MMGAIEHFADGVMAVFRQDDRRYNVILADPAWVYRDKNSNGGRGSAHKYRVGSVDDHVSYMAPFVERAAADLALFMWWTGPQMDAALSVLDGINERLEKRARLRFINATAFSWVKTTATGKWTFGCGHYTRGNVENCLLAVRGRLKVRDRGVSQLVIAPRGEHSEKPLEVHRRIERLYGYLPRLELYARRVVSGWDCHGDQCDVDAEVSA